MDFLAWAKTYEVRQHEHEQWTYPLLSGITSNIPIDETNARARRDEIERRVDVVIAGCEPSADDERLSWSGFDLIMSNPPYGLAMEFILESLRLTEKRGGEVAMLLRLGWLASETRADFHRKHPSDVYILPKRPSYAISAVCDKKCGWSQLYSLDPYARGPILIEEQVPAQASLFGEFANACVATAQAVAIEAPATCPRCRAKVRTSSSDSADYGWYVWGEGRGNRWFLLDSPEGA
jgi:hypothetical protein